MNPYDEVSIDKMIQFLEQQGRDKDQGRGRANLAELRRAAADPLHDTRSIWILGSLLPDTDGWPFDAYRLVATLYAMYASRFATSDDFPAFLKPKELPAPDSDQASASDAPRRKRIRKSLGESLRRLREQPGNAGADSLDKRLVALLDTNREDVAVPLRGFIQRLASKEVPVDFRQLLRDLLHWNGDHTRRQWARDYWQSVADDDPADEPNQAPQETLSSIH